MSGKLFIGQIPKNMAEDQLMPLFQPYGNIVELSVIRDKMTNAHRGCAFLTYTTKEEAEACIAALHNKQTLQSMPNPIQVKFAGSGGGPQSSSSSSSSASSSYKNSENKLFVGMIPKSSTNEELLPIFQPFGPIDELSILRGPDGQSKGCAFLRFTNRESAVACVTALNGALKLPGAPSNLVVKFAESEKDKQRAQAQKNAQAAQAQAAAQLQQQLQILQLANLAANPLIAQHLAYAQSTWMDQYAQLAGGGAAATAALGSLYGSPYSFLGAAGAPPPAPPPNPFASAVAAALPGGPAGSNKEGPPGANLFIYHLPQEYTDMDVYQAFSPFGNILSAKVFVDKETNQSRCFGFVSYDAPEAAQVAIAQMDGFNINGKRLKVQLKTAPRLPGRPY